MPEVEVEDTAEDVDVVAEAVGSLVADEIGGVVVVVVGVGEVVVLFVLGVVVVEVVPGRVGFGIPFRPEAATL